MKRLLFLFGLLAALRAFGGDDVTVRLDDVSAMGTHTNMWFECRLTIHNGTSTPFSITNLFVAPPGLALNISSLDGKELKRVYADPYINYRMNTAIVPPGDITFKEPYRLGGWHSQPFPLPESVQIVKVRVDGTLSGTGYTNQLTSNVVEVQVPN